MNIKPTENPEVNIQSLKQPVKLKIPPPSPTEFTTRVGIWVIIVEFAWANANNLFLQICRFLEKLVPSIGRFEVELNEILLHQKITNLNLEIRIC